MFRETNNIRMKNNSLPLIILMKQPNLNIYLYIITYISSLI